MRKILSGILIILLIAGLLLGGYVLYINLNEITISFNTNSSTTLSNIKVKKGESINLPTLESDGYTFLGWYVGEEKIDSNYKFDKTTILSAKWEKKNIDTVVDYTITFDSDGGSSVPAQKLHNGEKVIEPTPPIKTGYKFVEWQIQGEKKISNMSYNVIKTYDFNDVVNSDLKLVAKWEGDGSTNSYKIIFKVPCPCSLPSSGDGCSCSPYLYTEKIVNEGDKVTIPFEPKIGYTFVEWQLNRQAYDFDTPVNSDLELVAKFENS